MMDVFKILISLFLIYSIVAFLLGMKHKKNPYGLSRYFLPIGAIVWVDTVIFGLFFTLVSFFCLVLNQTLLFFIVYSVFWLVRSVGEQIYWFLEQFTTQHRNPPHTLWPKKWFKGEESWIVMQVTWQCVTVVFAVLSIYLFFVWFKTLV